MQTLIVHHKDRVSKGVQYPPMITDDPMYDFFYVVGEIGPRFPLPVPHIHSFELEWQWFVIYCRELFTSFRRI